MSVYAIPAGYNLFMKRGKEKPNNHYDPEGEPQTKGLIPAVSAEYSGSDRKWGNFGEF
jgi:hypothetical protein